MDQLAGDDRNRKRVRDDVMEHETEYRAMPPRHDERPKQCLGGLEWRPYEFADERLLVVGAAVADAKENLPPQRKTRSIALDLDHGGQYRVHASQAGDTTPHPFQVDAAVESLDEVGCVGERRRYIARADLF